MMSLSCDVRKIDFLGFLLRKVGRRPNPSGRGQIEVSRVRHGAEGRRPNPAGRGQSEVSRVRRGTEGLAPNALSQQQVKHHQVVIALRSVWVI